MYNDPIPNPYRYPDLFLGRKAIFTRLRQQLADPTHHEALVFVGRYASGKTSLLHQLIATFDDSTIAVYITLDDIAPLNEATLLNAIAHNTAAEVVRREFTLAQNADLQPPDDDLRTWFTAHWLPTITNIIRPHRRLAILIDNAHQLVDALNTNTLPEDFPAWFYAQLQAFPQLSIMLTFAEEVENTLTRLQPLAQTATARLTNFDTQESAWLLQEPVTEHYQLNDESKAAIYQATGGIPALLKRYGDLLFERWQTRPSRTEITPEDVKLITPAVYEWAQDLFRAYWIALSLNERLILTAMSSLLYADPLRKIDTHTLETWLIETDYPLDSTTINAALRSLDYREIVHTTPEGIQLNVGLMQRWLLENARLTTPRAGHLPDKSQWRWILLLIGLAIATVLIIMALVNNPTPPPDNAQNAEPTVTLSDTSDD